jgi:hypothetical protein
MTADYVINEVHHSKDPKRIEEVKMDTGKKYPREDVVKFWKAGKKIETSKGGKVEVYTTKKGKEFIKTVKDETEEDNLGKLPEY